MKKFQKETFSKISDSKRDRVINAAITEFALHGYSATNINSIAERAGISIGSLYTYFASKEDLFLTMAGIGIKIFSEAIEEMLSVDGTIEETLRRLLQLTVRYTHEHADLTKLYLNLSTEGLASMADRLAQRMELGFRQFYRIILDRAIARREIPENTDICKTAFFIDNQLMMLQLSLSTNYYRNRLHEYLGDISEGELVESMLQNLMRSIHEQTSPTP